MSFCHLFATAETVLKNREQVGSASLEFSGESEDLIVLGTCTQISPDLRFYHHSYQALDSV